MTKILIIEDNECIRESLCQLLKFEGYQILSAEDGIKGIKSAKDDVPDLIICDIMMPVMDGYEVLKNIRKDTVTATIPFIFLTARTEHIDRRYAMKLGADDYLTKPFTRQELLDAVKTRLEKHCEHADKSENMLNELRAAISYSVPHEFLTPLNAIIGYADLLNSNYKNFAENEIHDMLGGIVQAGQKLHNIIKNYIFYVQLEMLESKNESAKCLFVGGLSLTQKTITAVSQETAAKYDRIDDLELTLADHNIKIPNNYFEKLIYELADNSFKYSKKGSKVKIFTVLEDEIFKITVEDSGRGMTQAQIDKIGAYMQFERRTYEQQGLGLGLAIVKKIIKLSGGTLEIKSENQAGTCITVKIKA